jgi:hypothetical protein
LKESAPKKNGHKQHPFKWTMETCGANTQQKDVPYAYYSISSKNNVDLKNK